MNLLTDKMLAKGKDKFMSWLYLVLAIIFETSGTTLLKFSNGFTVVFPSIGAIISYQQVILYMENHLPFNPHHKLCISVSNINRKICTLFFVPILRIKNNQHACCIRNLGRVGNFVD